MERKDLEQEALARLEILIGQGLDQEVMDGKAALLKGNPVFCEPVLFDMGLGPITIGIQKPFSEREGMLDWKARCEKAIGGGLVYFGLYTPTALGDLVSLFYVSPNQKEWEIQRKELEEEFPLVWSYNVKGDWHEIGGISYREGGGGLVRAD